MHLKFIVTANYADYTTGAMQMNYKLTQKSLQLVFSLTN